MYRKYYEEIKRLKNNDLYRSPVKVTGSMDAAVMIEGQEMILLSSNNYLGLATNPYIKEHAVSTIKKYGSGAGASRLISGTMEIHEALEKRIARFKKCEAAIVFSTGYMANIGVISSLAGQGDLILSDELNHASIIDGCRLSGAKTIIYPHKDVGQVKQILSSTCKKGLNNRPANKFIVTDGVFSMDGDLAPLPELLETAKDYNAIIILDDAHGTGVMGPGGRGTSEHFQSCDDHIIQVGTFSKALGSLGGFMVGPKLIIEYIKNKARSFIYSTALPPAVCAACIAAIDIIEKDLSIKNRLWENVAKFKKGLSKIGYRGITSPTHIIPVIIKDAGLTIDFAKGLYEKGVFAPGIRPPTVPEKKSRIRVSLMSTHTDQQIDKALSAFASVGRQLRII